MNDLIAEYLAPNFIQSKLENFFGRQPHGISVIFYHAGNKVAASINDLDTDGVVGTGCVEKVLVASLFAIACYEQKVDLDESVYGYIKDYSQGSNSNNNRRWDSIKFHHLLNHSHGLDHAALDVLPGKNDLTIDIAKLMRAIEKAESIAEPGTVYNYSDLGSWLVMAILEDIYGESYHDLLKTKLFEDMGVESTVIDDKLCMSPINLLKIALFHLYGDKKHPKLSSFIEALRQSYPFELPTIPATGRLVYPGWVDYGNSFGHQGYSEEDSVAIRILADQDVAIVVSARQKLLSYNVFSSIFDNLLDDFNKVRPSIKISAESQNTFDTSKYIGTFKNYKYKFSIRSEDSFSLIIDAFSRAENGDSYLKEPEISRRFLYAGDQIFVSFDETEYMYRFILFTHPQKDEKYRFLRTSLAVLARSDE